MFVLAKEEERRWKQKPFPCLEREERKHFNPFLENGLFLKPKIGDEENFFKGKRKL